MTASLNTVIVGGGQAGLSVSYHLTRQGRDHVVFEQADRPGSCPGTWCRSGAFRRVLLPCHGAAIGSMMVLSSLRGAIVSRVMYLAR